MFVALSQGEASFVNMRVRGDHGSNKEVLIDMAKQRSNPDYLNGVPELLILQLLSRKPMYGYELVRSISSESGRELEFGEGSVYPILHKLEGQGFLSSRREVTGGRSRLVYRLTSKGEQRLDGAMSQWQKTVAAVNRVLKSPVLKPSTA